MNVAMKQVHRGAKLRLVKSGPIAAGDNKLDYTSTNAFIEFGVDISAYHGNHKIVVTDSAGKSASGYLHSVAPGGLALGANVITTNAGFETGGTGDNFNGGAEIDDGTSDTFVDWYTVAINDGLGNKAEATATVKSGSVAVKLQRTTATPNVNRDPAVTVGRVYKLSYWARGDGTRAGNVLYGNLGLGLTSTGITDTTYAEVSHYGTALAANGVLYLTSPTAPGIAYFDDIALEPLTDCAATGALIVSTLGGSTRSWTSVDTGFNPNLACTYAIYRVR